MCCFFQLLFHCAIEVKFDNFSVLWLNIAYFYLHGKTDLNVCVAKKPSHLKGKVSLGRIYVNGAYF